MTIDLGMDRGEPETYRKPTRRTVAPWFLPGLAVLLAFTGLTASAPQSTPVSELLRVPLDPGSTYALTEDGRLVTRSGDRVEAYDLDDGGRIWGTDIDVPTYQMRFGGDLVMLRPWNSVPGDTRTVAYSMKDGSPQWRHAGTVAAVAGSDALLGVASVRSVSAARRVQDSVDSLDPATGATRWTIDVPSTAVWQPIPATGDTSAKLLLVHDDRTMAVHDLATGERLARTSVPPANYGPENPAVAGGLILLRYTGANGSAVSAYDPDTLTMRWNRPTRGAYGIRACGELACLTGRGGVYAIDPATGADRWWRPGWLNPGTGDDLLIGYEPDAGPNDPAGLIDQQTGALVTDLRGWHPVTTVGRAGRLVLTRASDGGDRTMVGSAGPGDPYPRLLAELPGGTGDCHAVPGRLVCRSVEGELIVWAYREG